VTVLCKPCPCCMGRGEITGPKSIAFEMDREIGVSDPFNAKPRDCDECEGTGIITAVREAGITARAFHKVMPLVDRFMDEWMAELRAIETWEGEGGSVALALAPEGASDA
jgi:hypothetical protein